MVHTLRSLYIARPHKDMVHIISVIVRYTNCYQLIVYSFCILIQYPLFCILKGFLDVFISFEYNYTLKLVSSLYGALNGLIWGVLLSLTKPKRYLCCVWHSVKVAKTVDFTWQKGGKNCSYIVYIPSHTSPHSPTTLHIKKWQ